MAATSAALCLWRRGGVDGIEVLVVHPGGPYWANKDEGAWSLPKGEYDPAIELGEHAARREFAEEIGTDAPEGPLVALGSSTLKSGKTIHAWAIEGDLDATAISSNSFEIEWPPKSGTRQRFPEVDRALWCGPETARLKLNAAQAVFVERLTKPVTPAP